MFKKLFSLWLGLLSILASGTSALYPIYTFTLKKKFNLSIKSVNLFSSFINLGNNASFIVGFIYDKYGPTLSNIISFVILPGSFYILNIILNSSWTSISVIWLYCLAFCIGQGSTLLYASVLATTIKNFEPEISGLIVGLISSNKTLGNSLFTSLKVIFNLSIPNFINLLIIFCTISILLSIVFLRIYNRKNYNVYEKSLLIQRESFIIKSFLLAEFVSLLLFLVSSIIQKLFEKNYPIYLIFVINHIILLIIIIYNEFSFAGYIQKYQKVTEKKYSKVGPKISDSSENIESLGEEKSINDEQEQEKTNVINTLEIVKNNNEENDEEKIKEDKNQLITKNPELNVKSLFYMVINNKLLLRLFLIVMLSLGTVTSNLNNIKFISFSISQDKVKSDLYSLCYFSVNSLARMIASVIINKFIKSTRIFLCLIVILFICLFSQILGVLMNAKILFISMSLVGITNASLMTFIPIFCRTNFEISKLATILGIIHTGKAIGSLVFGSFIFTLFYHKNNDINIDKKFGNYCVGKNCFRGGYIINIISIIFSLIIAFNLYFSRIKEEEKRKYLKKHGKIVKIEIKNNLQEQNINK